MKRRSGGFPTFLSIALVVLGCADGSKIVVPPVPPETGLTLEFGADTGDRSTAATLGWTSGIPGVTVTLVHEDSANGSRRTFQGSSTGTLTIRDLPSGRYVVDAVRWLTDEERTRLTTGDDAVGFLARIPLATSSASQSLPISLVASRRRGIVISEFKGEYLSGDVTTSSYYFGGYLRLYNNADTVVYLDGFLVGSGIRWQWDRPTSPCSQFTALMTDPLGVWSATFHQLPGSGADYPLPPGGTAVVAIDAIDHRPLYLTGLDLRQAHFEFYGGGGDVDNPAVPNAADVGPRSAFGGHGMSWDPGAVVWLARQFDYAAAQKHTIPSGTVYARIPANVLLEVMAIKATYDPGVPECPNFVHPRFDRQAVKLLGSGSSSDDSLAHRRIQIPFTIAGRAVLQHTRTSAWDFTAKARAPFAKP